MTAEFATYLKAREIPDTAHINALSFNKLFHYAMVLHILKT